MSTMFTNERVLSFPLTHTMRVELRKSDVVGKNRTVCIAVVHDDVLGSVALTKGDMINILREMGKFNG